MAARQIIVPGAMPSRDANGRSLPAKLRFYAPGTALSTPKTVYADEALTVFLPFPLNSDAAGRFPQIWAEGEELFDVTWSRLDNDALLAGFFHVKPLADALIASATLAQSAAGVATGAAEAARDAEEAAAADAQIAGDAAAAANQALADATVAAQRAESAAANAEAIVVGDLSGYQLRTEKGMANGYAPLNASNKIPDAHLTDAPVSGPQQAAIDAVAGASIEDVEDLAAALAIAL